ncbi:hypothetical protein [uncultured Nostoc sp.]|uniref:hypothetical protein n=1 Tax=uncultured Nostoc sp. TaxID=340711 RepID=UPI0035CACAAC
MSPIDRTRVVSYVKAIVTKSDAIAYVLSVIGTLVPIHENPDIAKALVIRTSTDDKT